MNRKCYAIVQVEGWFEGDSIEEVLTVLTDRKMAYDYLKLLNSYERLMDKAGYYDLNMWMRFEVRSMPFDTITPLNDTIDWMKEATEAATAAILLDRNT